MELQRVTRISLGSCPKTQDTSVLLSVCIGKSGEVDLEVWPSFVRSLGDGLVKRIAFPAVLFFQGLTVSRFHAPYAPKKSEEVDLEVWESLG